jgi:hypothetical protein
MRKQTMILILWILSIVTIAYAIYRSTGEKITTMENGRQIVYGEPQHGLILGLCIYSGLCILSTIFLLLDKQYPEKEEPATLRKRTL